MFVSSTHSVAKPGTNRTAVPLSSLKVIIAKTKRALWPVAKHALSISQQGTISIRQAGCSASHLALHSLEQKKTFPSGPSAENLNVCSLSNGLPHCSHVGVRSLSVNVTDAMSISPEPFCVACKEHSSFAPSVPPCHSQFSTLLHPWNRLPSLSCSSV